MKMSKSVFSLVLCGAMLSSFVACGSSPTPETKNENQPSVGDTAESQTESLEGKTITFTMQKYGTDPAAQEKVLKELTESFKEETGITVKYSIIDWGQALTKLTLACTGGEAPDVADAFFTSSIVQMGQGKYGPMEISDILEELGGESAYFDAAIQEVKIDGGIYGIPWRMDTRAMVYNTEDFEAAGITEVPTTYDELLDVAQQLTQVDDAGNITRSGMIWNVSQSRFDQTWFALLAGHGGSVMDETYSEFTFNGTEGYDSLKLMYDSINVYKVCTSNVIDPSFDASAEFMAGKTSIVCGVNADFKTSVELQAPQLTGKFAAAVMPNLTGEGISSIAFAAPICIMNTTSEKDASAEWVKYFCSPENQLTFCQAVNLINSNKEVMANAYYSDDPFVSVFPLQADRAIQGDPPVPTWSQIDAFPNGPLNTMCTNIIAGQDIQQSLDQCEQESEKILNDN